MNGQYTDLKCMLDIVVNETLCNMLNRQNKKMLQVSHKSSSIYYHCFTVATFTFENSLFFAVFFQFVQRWMKQVRHAKLVCKYILTKG